MFNFFIKRTVASINVLWIVILTFFVAGCAMRGTWYHPKANEGYAENRACQTAGRNNEWVLKRLGVEIRVAVLPPARGHDNPIINVSMDIPKKSAVRASFGRLRAYGSSGILLQSDFSGSATGFFTINGKHVHRIYRFGQKVKVLSGSRFATERYPATTYLFGLTLNGDLPFPLT